MNLARRLLTRRLIIPAALAALAVTAACAPANPSVTTVSSVDLGRYAGTWYEIASVKQFFSIGLVNTTATYSPRPDGTIGVRNEGRYFGPDGPLSSIEGSAVALDATGARLNVAFGVTPPAVGNGNYWIVDLDPDYRWAAVSDPSGMSFFLLSRTKTLDATVVDEILERAAAKGIAVGNVTPTSQF